MSQKSKTWWKLTDKDTKPYPAWCIKEFAVGLFTTGAGLVGVVISSIWGIPIFMIVSAWGIAFGWSLVAHALVVGEKYLNKIKKIGIKKK